ncbi:YheT family hydrolase [Flavicella sediminum]|uniref:YheT family hydrolase n=1 Tax=Flavicella sediminum TaxID=2585141 RepID=UPI00111CF56C|nr:alpha/beta fold hydrolase [Flavicella sediminum]
MPLLKSDFKAAHVFRNKHVNTVFRTLFTKPTVSYTRTRITTSDQDFIDLDFSTVNASRLAILIHGLEGSSNSKYVLSTTKHLNEHHFDVVVFNLRGCSGELNKKFKAYHSGETGDLDFVITHLSKNYHYTELNLIGFSLGGNMTLKYLGEKGTQYPSLLKKAVAVSAPIDLKGSSVELSKKSNRIYMKRFLNTLVEKALQKDALFPNTIENMDKIRAAKNFYDFDHHFTAPSFGFKSAEDYWAKASANKDLKNIALPTYFITAKDDPFLSASCFPIATAKSHKHLFLELTNTGGHIGFIENFRKRDWLEKKITNFVSKSACEPLKP